MYNYLHRNNTSFVVVLFDSDRLGGACRRLTVCDGEKVKKISLVLFILFSFARLFVIGGLLYFLAIALFSNPRDSVLPTCMLIGLLVWYVLFCILRKRYARFPLVPEKPSDPEEPEE